jgi:DNA invertase Pin-like site-specific DNA recombinase
MRAIAYIRVSTEDQKRDGYSPAAQRASIARYADANGITVVQVVEDLDVSAGRAFTDRPGGAQVFAAIGASAAKRIADAVIVTAVDRIFRNTREGLEFIDWATPRGVRLVSMREVIDTSTATGKFQATLTLASAQFERDRLRERTLEAMAHLKREGRVTGEIPFGCVARDERDAQGRVVARYLERDPGKWPTREHVVGLYRNGLPNGRRVGFGNLRHYLRFEERLPSPRGRGWWSKATLKSLHDTHDRLRELPFAQSAAIPTPTT